MLIYVDGGAMEWFSRIILSYWEGAGLHLSRLTPSKIPMNGDRFLSTKAECMSGNWIMQGLVHLAVVNTSCHSQILETSSLLKICRRQHLYHPEVGKRWDPSFLAPKK